MLLRFTVFPARSTPFDLARIALKSLGLIGKGHARDWLPNQEELNSLIAYFWQPAPRKHRTGKKQAMPTGSCEMPPLLSGENEPLANHSDRHPSR